MANSLGSKLKHAWNAFTDQPPEPYRPLDSFSTYTARPDRVRLNVSNERSIISAIYTRISMDVASIDMRHVRLDDQGRYQEDINDPLNNCLNVEANLDQGSRAFKQDQAMSLLDKGTIAIVPVDTTLDPTISGSYDINTIRIGEILDWYPRHVRVQLYNDQTGRSEKLLLEKRLIGIVQNPLYSIMNEPNSTLKRLIRKLNLLDSIDEQSGSGKLDMIIQLPYVIKSESRREQANQRRTDIEAQLRGSKYGIAYTDGTEKITQLNRPVENNLLGQIEYLMKLLYSQLGITAEVLDGTADEATMLNYMNRVIEPIVGAIAEEYKRKFLTKTARSQGQSIEYFRDPFKLVPMKDIAEMADKFTRNEIVTSNEFRGFLGMKPSSDPKADQLVNSNMPIADTGATVPGQTTPAAAPADTAPTPDTAGVDIINQSFDSVDSKLDEVFANLGVSPSG